MRGHHPRLIPQVRLRSHQFPQWFSPRLRHLYKCLGSIERRFTSDPSDANRRRLCDAEESFRQEAESVKAAYESGVIAEFAASKSSKILGKVVICLLLCSMDH